MSSIISKIKISTYIVFAVITNIAIGQTITGKVIDEDTGTAIEYVNIGIPLQNIGTICNKNGYYKLNIDPKFDNYRLFFSCIGYQDTSIVISNLKKTEDNFIYLKRKVYELSEIIIKPNYNKRKTLGIIYEKEKQGKPTYEYVINGETGFEFGILIENKKRLSLVDFNLLVKKCTYDSITCRVNIYQANGKMDFKYLPKEFTKQIKNDISATWSVTPEYLEEIKETQLVNISRQPIYFKLSKNQIPKEGIAIDLIPYNLTVQGNFFVGIEVVEIFGQGEVVFYAKISDSYFRYRSFATWVLFPQIAPAISVDVLVEKDK